MAVTLAATREPSPFRASRKPPLMEKVVIQGGVPLSGTVQPAGNNNAALPLLAAAVLTTEPVVLRTVPRISDVQTMIALIRDLGGSVDWRGDNELLIDASGVAGDAPIDRLLSARIRASFLLAGPLLARFGQATMPPPGGDVIGRRRLDPHLDAFRAMGASATMDGDIVLRASDGLSACEVFMDEPSVMATENALMAAALTPGTT